MKNEKKGYVYIFTNPSFKENWVKIGITDNIDRRLYELSQATGVPLPFEMYATMKTIKYKQAETMIHKTIKILAAGTRHIKKEFFNLEPEEAATIFKMIADIIDDAEFSYSKEMTTEKAIAKNAVESKRKIVKTFYSMNLKDGNIIEFALDPQFKAEICGERLVMFEGKQWFLSPLTGELLKRIDKNLAVGSGFEVFRYDNKDKSLYDRWHRINNPDSWQFQADKGRKSN